MKSHLILTNAQPEDFENIIDFFIILSLVQ